MFSSPNFEIAALSNKPIYLLAIINRCRTKIKYNRKNDQGFALTDHLTVIYRDLYLDVLRMEPYVGIYASVHILRKGACSWESG